VLYTSRVLAGTTPTVIAVGKENGKIIETKDRSRCAKHLVTENQGGIKNGEAIRRVAEGQAS